MATASARNLGRRSILPYVVIALYGAILLLPLLDHGATLSRHEVLAAEPAREMLAGAPWSIQTFAGELRTAKQPTMSWLIAGSIELFHNRSTFTCRFPSAIAGILTAIAIASIGANFFNRRVGFFAGMLTLTTYWLQMQARLSEADMPLTAAVTLAMAVFVWGLVSNRSIVWVSAFFYTFAGFAFMLKAPGVLVPLSAAIAYALWTRNTRAKAILRHPLGLLIFAGLVLSWPVLVLTQHHEMLGVWWRELGERSAGRFGREKPTTVVSYFIDLPFYLWMSPLLLLPITPVAIVGAIRARRAWSISQWRFITCWGLPWLLLLTLLPLAKAKHYILPALPALSLLGGYGTVVWMGAFRSRLWAMRLTYLWFVGCMIVILGVQAKVLPRYGEYNASADLGRRATAMLPIGQRAVLVGLGEDHIAFYLDPIPRRIDEPADIPATGSLYIVTNKHTLATLSRPTIVLAEAEALHKGDTEDDRLVFAKIE